jgi:hypothetical protein
MNLEDYAEQLLQETIAAAEAEPDGALRLEIFTRLVAERLTVAGEFDEPMIAYYRARGVEVSGWSLDNELGVLHLFVTDYRGEVPPQSLSNTSIAQSFRRLTEFYIRSLNGYAQQLEESIPAFELADTIAHSARRLENLKLYLFSDAVARSPEVPDTRLEGISVTHHVWDLERLRRLDTSGLEHEPISVDISSMLGRPLPCLAGPHETDYQVYLAIFPGSLLASLYAQFGARLLERNVRAFLQARGAVNKGIRESLTKEPERFLAYNNGISITASSVTVVPTPSGGMGISGLTDLQIVNGGQTTASIHNALFRDKVDVSSVFVQAKLTVVSPDRIDSIVPFISQYSNTQNRVTGADFSANDPFHIKIEELSRITWAPALGGSQRQTHWFYERARGQYADELLRAGTPARRRQFKLMNPAQQKFTKTDLAKFENSWDQLPHLVSLGAEKNFREFMIRMRHHPGFSPDSDYFKHLIAKAILFRRTEKIVSAQQFGGYRANIVTYSIAKLAHATSRRLDLELIWRTQDITEATAAVLAELAHMAHDIIVNPSGRVRHIGEWSKKLDCWKRLEEVGWVIPKVLVQELIPITRGRHARDDSGLAAEGGKSPGATEEELILEANKVSADTWFNLSAWAARTNSLEPWQRSLAYSLGRLKATGFAPTVKQATQGLKALEEALRLGFTLQSGRT